MKLLGVNPDAFALPTSPNMLKILKDILFCKHPTSIISGPLGTSKSTTIAYALHTLCCMTKVRVAVVRNEASTLPTTIVETFRSLFYDGLNNTSRQPFHVYGGSVRPKMLHYKNGSCIVFGGVDDAQKIFGSEYGIIFWNEISRAAEADYADLNARLRGKGAFKNPFTGEMCEMFLGDCNPNSNHHWIVRRRDADLLVLRNTRLEDNMHFFNSGVWTESGEKYRLRLEASYPFDDYRRRRLVDGLWCSADDLVYPQFKEEVHVIPMERHMIPNDWKWRASCDFGLRHPTSVHLAAHSPDRKRVWIFRSLHMTGKTSSDMVPLVKNLFEKYKVSAKTRIVCDYAGDGCQVFQRAGLRAVDAKKDVDFGLDVFRTYLDGVDGRELRIASNSLDHPEDAELRNSGRPTWLVPELLSYSHIPPEKITGGIKFDLPDKSKGGDDAVDSGRYLLVDIARSTGYIPSVIASSSNIRETGLLAF